MGDRLAEFLYAAFVNSGQEVAGSDVPNWASLPAVDRERWESVATRARGYMLDQVFGALSSIEQSRDWSALSLAIPIELRDRFGRT